MSSGTHVEPYAGRQVAGAASDRVTDAIKRLGLSPRQQALNALWGWYRTQHYAARRLDWDGTPHVEGIEHESIATAGFIPPGFYDAGGSVLPLKFRRPTAPYALVKVVVDRFTGLLFSERRHPKIRCEGDKQSEDFYGAVAEAGRLWATMILARQYGGAMGSVAVGFKFVRGKPVFEVHDPRWCQPTFADRSELRLSSIEKRYQYPVEQRDREGKWEEVPYWYRRVIDAQSDVLYKPCPVPEDGSEPEWQEQERADHGFGFCPVVWIQNLPVQDDVDGDPDCHGIYSVVEAIDGLIAQSIRGTTANCDPTLVLSTDAPIADVAKGSSNAIKLPKGDSANYLELQGGGEKAAMELVDKLRAYALEVAQCVLDHPDIANRTATEIERVYTSMLGKADVLREQYGQRGVLPLMHMVARAAKALGVERPGPDGTLVRSTLKLPPKFERPAEGGELKRVEQVLGPGGVLGLQWGSYFEPSLKDIGEATMAAGKAKDAGLIDRDHASQFVAEHYRVENVQQMLQKIEEEKEQEIEREQQGLMASMGSGMRPPGEGGAGGW